MPIQESDERLQFVVISGGPDSTTLLNEILRRNVPQSISTEAIFINFGQPYLFQELTSARRVAKIAKVQLNEIVIPGLSHAFIGTGEFDYVIFRNIIEASYGIAASFARYHGGQALYHANIKEDVDDLPWMPEFFVRFSAMVNSINDIGHLEIRSPYLTVPKAEVFERADEMNVNLTDTWSCLKPGEAHCGGCRSCKRRQEAFRLAQMKDGTRYNK